jgi:hypothetical protein
MKAYALHNCVKDLHHSHIINGNKREMQRSRQEMKKVLSWNVKEIHFK